MLSKDESESRRGPPGFNSKTLASAHTAADLEVLREIDNVYFSNPSDFDAARYAIESLIPPITCESIEAMFTKLKRQHQVVSSKALHLISQQRDNFDAEFLEIEKIRSQLDGMREVCVRARLSIKKAEDELTISSFVILANFRKRQIIKSVLKSLELLKSLRSVEADVAELLDRKEYYEAINLILKSKKSALQHKQLKCISDLAARLQDTLDITEERLDSVLSELCCRFDGETYRKLRKAYTLLGKMQSAMEQLHMHYTSAVNEVSVEAMRPYSGSVSIDMKFQDVCQSVPTVKGPECLLRLCDNLFAVMRSYFLLVRWHSKHDAEERKQTGDVFDIEKNVSIEYIRQKLKAGPVKIWHDVQIKVSTFLKHSSIGDYPFEKFIQVLGILRRLTQVAEVFCGDKSDLLQDFIKTQTVTYIKNYHRGRMEELKLFLENEGWEQCPVKQSFSLISLPEFRQFKKHLNPLMSEVGLIDCTSSATSQDDSVTIDRYFTEDHEHSPFEIFRKENVTNDDIFGLESDRVSDDSEDEIEDIQNDAKEEDSPRKVPHSIIVSNTSLSVLKNCGQYLQICRYLPQTALEVIMLMYQLLDYYIYTVHLFFTSDLEVAKTTLYTAKLSALIKRVANSVSNDTAEGEIPQHLNLNTESELHGLAERIVAVESAVFLATQFDILQPYLETLVAQHQKTLLDHYKTNTLSIVADIRLPVYMCVASKAFEAKSTLIAMSNVKWDVKDVALQHSPYVDALTRKMQIFAMRLENIYAKVTLNVAVLDAIWSAVAKFIVHLLVEGFSNASKCTNAGRGLMQLDYRQLLLQLEKISGLRPVPYQEYVDRYVKAYYLPRDSLEDFVRQRHEYSNKHLSALITCACDNKRDRQELISVLENRI